MLKRPRRSLGDYIIFTVGVYMWLLYVYFINLGHISMLTTNYYDWNMALLAYQCNMTLFLTWGDNSLLALPRLPFMP